ncbi:MAG: hypothetical protein NT069_20490 [Planctomycetota bacterium]|nr:hypothetical protein [Planctomycetota bacterium]
MICCDAGRATRGDRLGPEVRRNLPDLIRSKETERDKDWADVSRLEEFWDARLQSSMCRGETEPIAVLSQLRSRAGFGTHFLGKSFENRLWVAAAIESTRNPITQAFLIPFAPDAELSHDTVIPVENVILSRLRQIPGGSPLHLSLVEVVRRRYIMFRKDLDRRDKEANRAIQSPRNA